MMVKILLKSLLISLCFIVVDHCDLHAQIDYDTLRKVDKRLKEERKLEKQKKKGEEEKEKKPFFPLSSIHLGINAYPFMTKLVDDNETYEGALSFNLRSRKHLFFNAGTSILKAGNDEVNYTASGQFVKVGYHKNLLKDTTISDALYVGVNLGYSQFKHSLEATITEDVFGKNTLNISDDKLYSLWGSVVLGARVKVVKKLYMGGEISIQNRIHQTKNPIVEIKKVPGYGANKSLRFRLGYYVMWEIPFKKRNQ